MTAAEVYDLPTGGGESYFHWLIKACESFGPYCLIGGLAVKLLCRIGVLGVRAKILCLEDVTQGKLWAYGDPSCRFAKRKRDELDLIRLAEAYPSLKSGILPVCLR